MRRGGPLPSAAADAVSSPGRSFTPLRKLPRIDPLHQTRTTERQQMEPIDHNVLPAGIRSRFVDNINGLRMHILEAGFEGANLPCVLLLHGFPELAYVWSKVMLPLAEAGYHVIAPDLRGYGRTTGWDPNYDCDLRAYGLLNMVRDVFGL